MHIASEEEIIFEASTDLFNESKTQILVFKNKSKILKTSNQRKLISYCWEYCGITGLSYQTLRFTMLGRDIKPETIVSNSCNINVKHKAEFALEPPNSLKSSLRSIIVNGEYSDLDIHFGSEQPMKAHKCILSCRSSVFDEMLSDKDFLTEIDVSKYLTKNDHKQAFTQLINFIYCGEIVFPEDPIETFRIIELAHQFRVEDLIEICEEDILYKLDENNILNMLFIFEKAGFMSEQTMSKARATFLKHFETISSEHDNIEEMLSQIPGLVKTLLMHACGKKKSGRKVTFVNYEV